MNDENTPTIRVDLHCHSSASARGPLRPGTVPECATPPTEVYELAKHRGMDFVTITDHDTIDGVLQIAAEPDVFVSVELTARFAGEPRAVHVLCFGISPDDHARLQELRGDVTACAAYLHEHEIACSLAHPFWNAEAPLTGSHRRLLARLFPVWETRNGKRPSALNAPAAVYVDTHGGGATAGSDDHSGTDIGHTFTRAPHATTTAELLAHIRGGLTTAHGSEGSHAKTAHAALALAARTPGAPSESVKAWLTAMGRDHDSSGLVAALQGPRPVHAELERGARRIHERKLGGVVRQLEQAGEQLTERRLDEALATAALPAKPYIRARAAMFRERWGAPRGEEDPVRVALLADGLDGLRGVGLILEELRDRGLPGYEIDLIGTDAGVDHRLSAVSELQPSFLPGVTVGVPSLFAVADALTSHPYDLVHVATAGPAGAAGAVIAAGMGLPVIGGCHTELAACAELHGGGDGLAAMVRTALAGHYARCSLTLSPGEIGDATLSQLGVAADRIARWRPGVDLERFSPARYNPDCLPDHGGGRFNILYAGRLAREKGIDLLAEAFLIARDRDPRLHLVLAGSGPRENALRTRVGPAATFAGWLSGDELAQLYATADLFVHPGGIDCYARSVLEAQASGLPVLAAAGSAAAELIESDRSGCVVDRDPEALAGAIRWLARRGAIRERLSTGALIAVRERSWQQSLAELGQAYAAALGAAQPAREPAAPAPAAPEHSRAA